MFYDNGQEFGNAENTIFLGAGFNTNLSVTNATFQNPTEARGPFPRRLRSCRAMHETEFLAAGIAVAKAPRIAIA